MSLTRGPIALAAVILLGGCSAPLPSATPSSSEVTGSPTTAASPSSPAAIESPWQRSGTIDKQFTTPALEYRSTGTYLVWSSGVRADPEANVAPDLFGSEPGGPVSLLYDNPNRDSRLELVGGDEGRIVFVENNARAFGLGRWKMWYLARPGAAAALIDEGGGKLPFFDLSAARLVWTVADDESGESQLWLLDLETMERRMLLSADSDLTQYWFPAIDGHLVVYGTLELTADGQTEERHVYLIDVDDDVQPQRLDHSQSATQPDIRGNTVIWKESSLDESFLVGGQLVRYSLSTAEVKPLTLDPANPRYIFPSIGHRLVAAWSDNDRALYLADLATGQPLKVLDLGPTADNPHDNVGLIADLAGDLLAFVYGPADGDLELRWIAFR